MIAQTFSWPWRLGVSLFIPNWGWAVHLWTRTYLDLRISKILHVALGLTSSIPRSAATAMAKGEILQAIRCRIVIDSARFVEFETAGDLKVAVDKLDNQDFKGASVRCVADVGLLSTIALSIYMTEPNCRLRMRSRATTATALGRPHRSVEAAAAATPHPTATTAVAHLPPVATAPVVMTTVVAPRRVTITTPVTAATVPHLHHARLAHPSTIRTHHPLVAGTAMILTVLHLVVDTRIRTLPTDMIGPGLDRPRGLMVDTMSVPRRRDTGDCSSSFPCRSLDGGQPLIMTEPSNAFSCHSPKTTLSAGGGDSRTSGLRNPIGCTGGDLSTF